MRKAAFLPALSFFTVATLPKGSSLLLRSSSRPQAPTEVKPSRSDTQRSSHGVRMSRLAEILVVPVDLAAANRAELASLRDRVAQAESASQLLDVPDLAVREHISRQAQLLRALLRYEEMRDADAGKSPAALQVQRRLNKIEGRSRCEVCHAE